MNNSPFFFISSASTGSTLLTNILDNHSEIALGPELFLFNKDIIFDDFEDLKSNFRWYLENGILPKGHSQVKSFFINKASYFVDNDHLVEFMKKSNNIKEFFDQFFGYYLQKRGKQFWGEKTGSNAYHIDKLLKLYPDLKLIHLVRDPYDSILSNYKRNNTGYHAVTHYLYNHFSCLRFVNYPNYLRIKYEDFVTNPKLELEKICALIGVKYEDNLLENKSQTEYWKETVQKSATHIESWNNSPQAGNISSSSIGKGRSNFPQSCGNVIDSVKLSRFVVDEFGFDKNEIYDINYLNTEFGYEPLSIKNKSKADLMYNHCRFRLIRFLKALKNGKLKFNVLFSLK